MTTDAPVLNRCPFFAQFRPEHLQELESLGSFVHFARDETLCREDDRDTRLYVLLSGRVALERTHDGCHTAIDTLYPGDELGWPAILEQKKELAARALEPVDAMAFDSGRLRLAFDSNPQFARAFLERLASSLARHLLVTRRQLSRILATGALR
ncbi:MAG TPA: cyclic nucleotide-binding domain-containing protein [Candidatus Solibacter sp.]|nr:cyclic nucleotide-binding domain-containing protein [Candidatus Solibacter sp.]